MKKAAFVMLALLFMLIPALTAAAADSTTEQKYNVLKQQGIFSGFPDGTSRLYESMTREQFAVVLFKLLDLPSVTRPPSFNDVFKTRWSFDYIEAVASAGLMIGLGNRTFGPANTVTVEQLASVLVHAYGLTGNGSSYVYGKVSSWARDNVSIALDHKLITTMNDYTVNATRGLLVEAAYALYARPSGAPLSVRYVEPVTNQVLKVSLYQTAADPTNLSRFVLKDVFDNLVDVNQATISTDGLTIMLTTDRQVGNRSYSLLIDGNPWWYAALPVDTISPQAASVVNYPDRTIEVTFQEAVDSASATNPFNYSFDNGLQLAGIQLSSDLRKVTLTTTPQVNGTTYRLTVRNVTDLVGNVMNPQYDFYFVGNNDSTKPKVNTMQINPDATLTLKFSEKINAQHAALTYHYSIDKGLAVLQAALQDDGSTVVLTTSAQANATLYNLTVSGIPDLAGNVMDSATNLLFGGIANPVYPIQLQALSAINQNTLEISFNRALTDADVAAMQTVILTDNGSAVSMTGWSQFALRKPGSDRAVTVQFRTTDTNPVLFLPGHVYVARVTGISALLTTNNANQQTFAGTETGNPVPYVTQVIPLSHTAVKLLFSEPVKHVDDTLFLVQEQGGPSIGVVSDNVNDTGKIVTEVILTLHDSLTAGKVYAMSFQPGVTDAAGWNGLNLQQVLFAGI